MNPDLTDGHEQHRDPITGAPGAHPVGVGVGTAVGGAATGAVLGGLAAAASSTGTGAALGTTAGPLGTVVGVLAGGVVGALTGKAVAESVSPTIEPSRQTEEHCSRPAEPGAVRLEDYPAAYYFGSRAQTLNPDCRFEDLEGELRGQWELMRPRVAWEKARSAVRDGWTGTNPRSSSVGPGNARILEDRPPE